MQPRSLAAQVVSAAMVAMPLVACRDDPEPRAAPASNAAARPATGVVLEPRHEATYAQGIDFTRPGFPTFVKEAQGVSGPEPWGRWTDANLAPAARFRLDRRLPAAFTLELRAHGLGPNAYQPVKVRAGGVERALVLGNPARESYRIEFTGVDGDTIEIVPPAPILPRELSAQNSDARRLGLGLISIRILD